MHMGAWTGVADIIKHYKKNKTMQGDRNYDLDFIKCEFTCNKDENGL